MKAVMSIAGIDPSGGAGLYTDLAVIRRLGFYPCGVATALTYQNTCEVRGVYELDQQVIANQISSVLDDLDVVAIKIGLVGSSANAIADLIRDVEIKVVDPVLKSTTGFDFSNLNAYKSLARICDVITPNVDEAQALAGCKIEDVESAKDCAKRIFERFGCAVVITGGKLGGVDVIFDGNEFCTVKADIYDYEVHGTGCVYSSALTCYLAKGYDLFKACEFARAFVLEAVKNSLKVGRCLRVVWV
jgi:hydroxymethylpyrimidine/phosphomethylpyrimidine kinase